MSSPISNDGTPSTTTVDSPQLNQRARDVTPSPKDLIEKRKAEAKQVYDNIIAIGGRPTRSIRPFLLWKITARDGIFISQYDNDQRIVEVLEIGRMASEEDCLAYTYWCNEADKFREELKEWEEFKEAQRIHNQSGRSKWDLELENTDADLVEVLSKLNDWQEFEWTQQNKVYEAERFQEQCHQKIKNIRYTGIGANPTWDHWMEQIEHGQERLEAFKEKSMWVKGQWPEVLAEASDLIAAASPELQRQLENKFEMHTNATYRLLQLFRARPSRPIHPPDENAGLAQRLDHWILENLDFTDELREWKFFLDWQRFGVKTSQIDPRPKLFKDLVKYRQYKLHSAISWVDCWRFRARQLAKAKKSTSLPVNIFFPPDNDEYYSTSDDEDDEYFQSREDVPAFGFEEVQEAKRAEFFVNEAEEAVSIAAKRLERSKQELEVVLADHSQHSKGGNRESSHKSENAHRRSKKKEVRKKGANTGTTNTEQQALPAFLPDPNQVDKDDDAKISDVPESSRLEQAETEVKVEEVGEEGNENTVMADTEDHKPITNTISRKMPPPSRNPGPATGRITKNKHKEDKNPGKKPKIFTEQQTALLLNAASTDCPPPDPTSKGEEVEEEEPDDRVMADIEDHKPITDTISGKMPSPSRKTGSVAGRITKSKHKEDTNLGKKSKMFTEQQTALLLDAASS